MRLLFPFSNHLLANLHKFLALSLHHFVTGFDSVLTNVLELVKRIDGKIMDGDTTICAISYVQSVYKIICNCCATHDTV